VRGYLGVRGKRSSKSIQVRYPPQLHRLFPGERPDDDRFDRQPQGAEWDFYTRLAAVDGIIVIGGGYTTKIAGLIAIGSKTPIIALAGFGGAAENVLENLRQERHSIAAEGDLNVMAQQTWGAKSAGHCINALLDQIERRRALDQQTEILKSERKRVWGLTMLAAIGSVLFAVVLLALAEALHSDQTPRWISWILFGAPAAAGASGAAIRVLWDHYSRDQVAGPPLKLRPVGMTISLGFWASGVTGALFLMPQIASLGQLQATQAFRLIPFSSMVGLLTGLTLDRVFPRLLKIEVPVEAASLKVSEVAKKV
jgi:hypothetical protein